MKYLGETLDIHTGGVDLAFPHHENEIAQSEAATGHRFVNLWLHAEHLIIDGEKMSKSLGNFFTLRDLFAKGRKPSTIRYLLLSVPYRRQLNFTEDGSDAGGEFRRTPAQFLCRDSRPKDLRTARIRKSASEQRKREADFDAGLADDLNTALALAAVFDLVRDVNTAMDRGEFRPAGCSACRRGHGKIRRDPRIAHRRRRGQACQARFRPAKPRMGGAEIEALIEERNAAKKRRDFKRSDEIRQQAHGFWYHSGRHERRQCPLEIQMKLRNSIRPIAAQPALAGPPQPLRR